MDTAKYFCVHSLLPFSAAADVWLIFDERLLIVFFTSFSGSFIVVSFGFLWFCRWPVFCTLITFPIFGMAYIYSNWQTKDLFVAARWCQNNISMAYFLVFLLSTYLVVFFFAWSYQRWRKCEKYFLYLIFGCKLASLGL